MNGHDIQSGREDGGDSQRHVHSADSQHDAPGFTPRGVRASGPVTEETILWWINAWAHGFAETWKFEWRYDHKIIGSTSKKDWVVR